MSMTLQPHLIMIGLLLLSYYTALSSLADDVHALSL